MKKVAVLGSGVMGSQIAALLAGFDLNVLLLDILPIKPPSGEDEKLGLTSQDLRWRNKIALAAIQKLRALKPPPFFCPSSDVSRIHPGNLEDHLPKLGEYDWVIEAIVERLDIKRELYAKLDHILQRTRTIVSSNTSGLSMAALLEGRSGSFQERFLVTHFFNPPRYMKLLEIVPGPHTDRTMLKQLIRFCEERLGKGIVIAKDTPNFIANRIGIYHFLDIMHLTEESGWPIEAVDAVLGPATAHPKSAIFRTADVVGLDTLTYVAETVIKGCPQDEGVRRLRIPQYLQKMITKGWTGQKVGQGFYAKDPVTKVIRALDPGTLEYRPSVSFRTPSLGEARSIDDPAQRLRHVVFAKDQAGEIAWPAISRTIVYAAQRIPEIADDIVQIDRAMRWGYNLQLGPFEMWDALGPEEVAKRLEEERIEVPPTVQMLLASGKKSFYAWHGQRRSYFHVERRDYSEEPGTEKSMSLRRWKEVNGTVERNSGASLIDLGDGVLCCEFHTKMNAIDNDVIAMLNASLDRVEREGVGLLIANQGQHFSAGANLLLILMTAQQKRWDELEKVISSFQSTMQRMRFSTKPIMAVPFGMAVGGGCEVVLGAGRRHAAAESYIGLVEVGAGVIPAGAGCKNFLLHFEAAIKRRHNPKNAIWFSADDGGPFPKVARTFETIGTARVSGSAFEAQQLSMLTSDDRITLDQEHLLYEAKNHLLEWSASYVPPQPRDDIWLPGRGGKMALLNAVREWRQLGIASEYDEVVAERLAHVLSGGDQPTAYRTNEQHILDLERESFLMLCGNEKTQARMAHLLKTGKPLRN